MSVKPLSVRVWDLPTRLFHWALVLCFVGSIVTGKIAGAAMVWHARIGFAIASLLLFRLIWGLIGGRWSRFGSFLHSPRSVMDYLRGSGDPARSVGHNPLGSLSVFALLAFLMAQVGTGLFSDDKAEFSGPLSVFVTNATVRAATWYHKNVGQAVLLTLVAVHLAAIAYYQLRKREDLIGPMLHGVKTLDIAALPSRDDAGSRLAALVVLGLCAAAVAWLVNLGS